MKMFPYTRQAVEAFGFVVVSDAGDVVFLKTAQEHEIAAALDGDRNMILFPARSSAHREFCERVGL